MDFLEKDLEDIIHETYNRDNNLLNERGLYLYGKMYRQLRIGNYGVADLVLFDLMTSDYGTRYLRITIVELKKDEVNTDTMHQVFRYAKGIKRYIENRKPYLNFAFDIVMIGRYINMKDSLCYMPDLLSTEPRGLKTIDNFYLFSYDFDAVKGIYFKECKGYGLTNEGF